MVAIGDFSYPKLCRKKKKRVTKTSQVDNQGFQQERKSEQILKDCCVKNIRASYPYGEEHQAHRVTAPAASVAF